MRIRAMINSANCLIYCPTRLTCPTRPKVCEALSILISHYSSPITNRRAKPFIRRGTLHGVWRSRVILTRTAATYAILRIWLYLKTAKTFIQKLDM